MTDSKKQPEPGTLAPEEPQGGREMSRTEEVRKVAEEYADLQRQLLKAFRRLFH